MKAVYLDYASLDQQDLDFQALHAAFDPLVLYPTTSAAEIARRVCICAHSRHGQSRGRRPHGGPGHPAGRDPARTRGGRR